MWQRFFALYVAIESPSNWLGDHACKNMDPDIFFPVRGQSTAPAKAICAKCPVRIECLEHAIALSEKLGVWGGASERERRRIRRVRSLARKAGLVSADDLDESDIEDEIDAGEGI